MKKYILVSITSAVIIAGISISAYAAYGFLNKEKNDFQKAIDEGIEISQVDTNDDFKYTKLTTNEDKNVSKSSEENIISEKAFPGESENISDPKTAIYNRMLNTIDYFNALSATMETSMLNNEIATVEYNTNINSGESYQKVSVGEKTMTETYGRNDSMINVNNTSGQYLVMQGQMFGRDDAPYIPLEKRIVTEDDGMPCYYYRKNITNCSYASYSIFPQEFTFSYLKDFELWDITDDNADYLGRKCVKIEGVPSSYIAEKHNIDNFTMIVDSQTGILMQFTGTKDGEVSRYMKITDISLESNSSIKHFNANEYSSFVEVKESAVD